MATQIHSMPSVFVLEHDIPKEMVTDLNIYLDAYLKEKVRKSLASTLVGQIQHGQQLLIAQEVKEAMDKHNITDFGGWNSITTKDHTQQGVSQEMFIHPLIKAVQELSAKVEELEKKLSEEN